MIEFNPIGQTLQLVGPASNGADVQALMADQGFAPARVQRNAVRERRVIALAGLMADVMEGREEPFMLREALNPTKGYAIAHLREAYPGLFPSSNSVGLREVMSYSDYSALTIDVLDRMLYGYYTAAPITNMPLVKKHPLRDFRVVARYEMNGATKPFTRLPSDTTLTPHGAGEPPTERAMTQPARITYQPQLYQGEMAVNWRALVNDDLGIFADMTNRLAISGRRTIYQFITSLYVATTGPNTNLYNAGFTNLITTTYGASTNNPPLSFQGLIDGITVLEKQLDPDGQPITFDGTLYLWFGPALYTTAMALMKAVQADISVGGGTTNAQGFPSQRLRVGTEYVVANMVPIQDKYIPIVCTTSGIKNTMWGLTYAPESQARPSLEYGYLTGFETPQIYQKVPNTMRAGGGVVPEMGDFHTGNQEFKGVLVLGGTQIDGRSTVASTGAGV